ncbi:MAG: PAS domain S-box protein [Chloroflexi bacterium]|nr:PAS domain S-box protein [Chloroflexota bacterium]
MEDVAKEQEELIQELQSLRQRVAELEEAKASYQPSDDDLLKSLFVSSLVGVYIVQDRKFRLVNEAFARMSGYTQAELVGMDALSLVLPEDRDMVRRSAVERLKGQQSSPYEFRTVHRSGEIRWVMERVASIHFRGQPAALGSYMDITEQKRDAERILYLNETLRLIRNINHLIVQVDSQQELLQQACQRLVVGRNYASAWIGLVKPGSYDVLPAAQSGFEENFLSSLMVRWDDSGAGRGPTGTAINTGRPFVTRDILSLSYELGRAAALRREYRSSVALPLTVENKVIGVLNVYSRYPDAFDNTELSLLVELAGDISLGIEKIRQREIKRQMDEALRKSEERYHTVLDTVMVGRQIIGFDWRYLYVDALSLKHGRRTGKEELLGRTVMEAYPGIESTPLFDYLRDCMEGRVPHRAENELTFPDGSKGWFELTIEPVPEGILMLSIDITERKQAE